MKRSVLRQQLYRLATMSLLLPLLLALLAAPVAPALADGGAGHGNSGGHSSSTGGTASAVPMETVHASYLDLTTNIGDLRARVEQWQKGDEGSLGVAQEKLERIEAVLGHVEWPKSMTAAIAKTKQAVSPMNKALKAKDTAGATEAAKLFGDASHDVVHAFYGDWLPELKNASFTGMAPHSSYLDITTNIADLKSRVEQWQKGDEASLGIAQEKADRIAVLVQHMAAAKLLTKPVYAIGGSLTAVNAALKAKDATAAQTALKPLSDASHDLTHDFYTWLDSTAGVKDPACTQAAYLDLTLNIADLRSRLTAWEKGDEASLGIAQEKLERIQALVGHTVWPKALALSVYKAGGALAPLTKALKDKDVAAAQTVAKTLGDASHDITHDFYGVWLMSDDATMKSETTTQASGGHGAEVVGLDGTSKALVLGGFGSLNLLVVAAAFFLKRTMAREAAVKAAHQTVRVAKGSDQ